MRPANFVTVVTGNLAERKMRTLGAILIVAFAASVVMVVAAVGLGFLRGVVRKAEQALPPDLLSVTPKSQNILMFSLQAPGISGETLGTIRKLPGVAFVSPQMALRMPLRAQGTILGQSAETDAVVVGIGEEAVHDTLLPGFEFKDPPDADGDPMDNHTTTPIPCIVPKLIFDLYNRGYAESAGLPKINEDYLKGKAFTLLLGESVLLGDRGNSAQKKHWLKMRIAGITANPALMRAGIMIPISRAEKLNKWYTGKDTPLYSAAHVKVGEPDKIDTVTSSIRSMDLVVESQAEYLGKVRFGARAAALVVSLFAIVVSLVSAVSVLNTFALIMAERRGEVGLMRAVGATRGLVAGLYAAEAAFIGLAGGLLGALGSGLILYYLNERAMAALQGFSSYAATFIPEQLFRVTPLNVLTCALGAMLACTLSALPTIHRATARNTASLVGEN